MFLALDAVLVSERDGVYSYHIPDNDSTTLFYDVVPEQFESCNAKGQKVYNALLPIPKLVENWSSHPGRWTKADTVSAFLVCAEPETSCMDGMTICFMPDDKHYIFEEHHSDLCKDGHYMTLEMQARQLIVKTKDHEMPYGFIPDFHSRHDLCKLTVTLIGNDHIKICEPAPDAEVPNEPFNQMEDFTWANADVVEKLKLPKQEVKIKDVQAYFKLQYNKNAPLKTIFRTHVKGSYILFFTLAKKLCRCKLNWEFQKVYLRCIDCIHCEVQPAPVPMLRSFC
uniref:Uncharacterized protein n=1 Tax=Ditylenchus dipsaci TaxID=166011 RepID=A0A915DW82_9BILA